MNITLDQCLEMMSIFDDYEDRIRIDDLNPTSSDSEGAQSAPELEAVQRKIENARLYPLGVQLYWTYEEMERGTSKKERKRRMDVPKSNKLKRKRFSNGGVRNPFQVKSIQRHELGYDADDEI